MNEHELLKFALENGIISLDTIQQQYDMNERTKYLNQHKYKIWQGKENGKYYTYLPDENKGRKTIKRNSRKDVEDAIVKYYSELENEPYITVVFHEWVDEKLKYGEIQKQTYDRYISDYGRHIKGSVLEKVKIKYIDEEMLEDFIKSTIHDKQLSAKAWGNLRVIIRGVFRYSKKKGYSDLTISTFMDELDLSKKAFKRVKREDADNVFTEIELHKLKKYALDNPTLSNLGYLVAMYTGMRVGEVVALKKEDIFDDYIYVRRMQIRYHDENGKDVHEVVENTKTEAGTRKIAIVPALRPVLKAIMLLNPFGEYVFFKNNRIMTKHCLCMALYNACDKVDIPRRSMHVLRKTFATHLINAGVDEAIIVNQMGHTEIQTTRNYYYYNDKSMDVISANLSKAINY